MWRLQAPSGSELLRPLRFDQRQCKVRCVLLAQRKDLRHTRDPTIPSNPCTTFADNGLRSALPGLRLCLSWPFDDAFLCLHRLHRWVVCIVLAQSTGGGIVLFEGLGVVLLRSIVQLSSCKALLSDQKKPWRCPLEQCWLWHLVVEPGH